MTDEFGAEVRRLAPLSAEMDPERCASSTHSFQDSVSGGFFFLEPGYLYALLKETFRLFQDSNTCLALLPVDKQDGKE